MDLETIADNARFSLEQGLRIIKHGGVAERSGKAYGAASLMYHRLALCELLAEARTDRFQVYLRKSALVRLHHVIHLVVDIVRVRERMLEPGDGTFAVAMAVSMRVIVAVQVTVIGPRIAPRHSALLPTG